VKASDCRSSPLTRCARSTSVSGASGSTSTGDRADYHAPPPSWAALAGLAHEQVVQYTAGVQQRITTTSWAEAVQVTRDLMTRCADAIGNAALERTIPLDPPRRAHGRVDRLVRVFGRYMPVEIKQRAQVQFADRLQLDFYLWLLQGVQPESISGEFWLGGDDDGYPLHHLTHEFDEARLLTAFQQIVATLAQADAPPIFLGSHCEQCGWQAACHQSAQTAGDIALLPDLTRKTWAHFQRAGIRSLADVLALSVAELRRFDGVGAAKARTYLDSARAHSQQQPILRAGQAALSLPPGAMLDIETEMAGKPIGRPWCFGWSEVDGSVRVAVVAAYFDGDGLTLPDGRTITIIPDSDAGWRLVAESAEELGGLVYHWSGFEPERLRHTAPEDAIAILQPRMHDLLQTFKRNVTLPMRSRNIKAVAHYFGYRWPDGSSAQQAWGDYQAWRLDNDADALARACAYQNADVEALAVVWDWLVSGG
jgi:predicted RecB family nuclease